MKDQLEKRNGTRISHRRAQLLQKPAVDDCVTHPLEMPTRGLRIRGAENLRGPPIREFQRRFVLLIRIQLRNIRPKVDVTLSRLFKALMPSVEAVLWRWLQALTVAHHLPMQCLRPNTTRLQHSTTNTKND